MKAGPVRQAFQFYLTYLPTGDLIGTYSTVRNAHKAKEVLERRNPEGAARGDYEVTWGFTFEVPKVEPHRFEFRVWTGTFGPICAVCDLPVDFAPHTNREEAWEMG